MIIAPLVGSPVITQPFGVNPQNYAKYGLDGHDGIDFRAAVGTVIYAACEGYLHNGDNGNLGYGKFVQITSLPYLNDGTCREVTCGHLSRQLPQLEGQFVHMGDIIGYSGATGDATGPHLHFGYRKIQNGNIVNYSNGFHGFVDISKYLVPLSLPPLFS